MKFSNFMAIYMLKWTFLTISIYMLTISKQFSFI